MYLVVLFVITVLSAILALSLLVFKDEKQIIISVLCENMLLKNFLTLRLGFFSQETFVENKQDGVSRKYIPPAR